MSNETLDPGDWSEFRALAHRAVDDVLDHLAAIRELPAWQEAPQAIRRGIEDEPLPRTGQGESAVYQDFLREVLPYPNANLHPRFFGWVQGNGTPFGNLADYLASTLNPHMAGFNQTPALVEQKVIDWLIELMGFPPGSGGVLESGGTMANVLGLATARTAKADFDVRREGLQAGHPSLVVYGSSETHGWLSKGAELLGIGRHFTRFISVDSEFRLNVLELERGIEEDSKQGFRPICVVGTAGTVNTGATDDLEAIADLCERHSLWFHVDGAFGALAKLSPRLAPLVDGLDRADSLAFDLHKWMFLPFDIACLLVREQNALTSAFAFERSYIAPLERGLMAGGLPFADRGIDLTRSFKALKAWMCLKAYGVEKFARLIEQTVNQTQRLVKLIEQEPALELVAPAPMNVCCFRVIRDGLGLDELNALNRETLLRIQESGDAVPSSTVIDGKFAIRFCNVNHRTRDEDIDFFVGSVLRHSESA